MRFNQEDLKKGNVSQERMKEVVLQTILKLDAHKNNSENLQRIGSKLLNDVEKIFLFKKSEGNEKEDIEKYNYEFNLSNLMFFEKLIKANLELIKTERIVEFVRQQELQKAIQDQILDLKILNEQKRISDNDFQSRMALLNSELIQQMMKQRDTSLNRIQDLMDHRNQLVESIHERQKAIQASRVIHQAEALKFVDQVQVGDVKTFEGMSPQNQEKFVHGYFALDEIRTRRLAEIDLEIKAEMDAMSKNGSDPKKSTELVQHFQHKTSKTGAKIEQLKQEKVEVEKEFIQHVKRLGDETDHKHINSKVSDAECNQHLHAFENQKEIKVEIDAHRKVTKEQTEQIVVSNIEVKKINKDILSSINDVKEINSEAIGLLESMGNGLENNQLSDLRSDIELYELEINRIQSDLDLNDVKNLIGDLDLSISFDPDFENNTYEMEKISMDSFKLKELDFNSLNLSDLSFDDLEFTGSQVELKTTLESNKNRQSNS